MMKLLKMSVWVVVAGITLAGCSAPGGGKPTATISDDDASAGFRIKETPRGAMMVFNDRLLFETGKAELSERSQGLLERVATLAKEKNLRQLEIGGHTDNQGTEQLNQRLSEQRSAAVKAALVAGGMRPERIKATGYGMSKPEANNATSQGRALNRRAEILFVNFNKAALGGDKMEQGFAGDVTRLFASIGDAAGKTFDKIKEAFK